VLPEQVVKDLQVEMELRVVLNQVAAAAALVLLA
jgi:hypothetical protein